MTEHKALLLTVTEHWQHVLLLSFTVREVFLLRQGIGQGSSYLDIYFLLPAVLLLPQVFGSVL